MKAFHCLFLILFLSGCQLGPRYHPPCFETPQTWKEETPCPKEIADVDLWWEIFDDPTLNGLIEKAITSNPDLFIALERIFEARGLARIEKSNLYPQVTFDPIYNNLGQLFKLFVPSAIFQQDPALALDDVFRIHQQLYGFPFNLNYELDLWGKFRGLYKSAKLAVEAEQYLYCQTLLLLTSDLASNYFSLRSFDSEIEILKETITVRKEGLSLTESRFEKGIVGYLDVSSAQTELANVEADYKELVRLRKRKENAISALLGIPASCFSLESLPLPNFLPEIPSGIPSDLLRKRPDILEAERKMASEHALIGVAYASYFPSLQITGTLGFLSPDFREFLRWTSRYWFYGANIGQNVFDGGRTYGNVQATWSRFFQASADYQKKVLTAFQEVEDSLTNLIWQKKTQQSLEVSVQSAEKAAHLSEDRYLKGVTDYLEVVMNERTALTAKRNLTILYGQRFLSTVDLIKSFGGGWNTSTGICSCPEEECPSS